MPRQREFAYPHVEQEHVGRRFAPLPERPNLAPRTALQALMEAGPKCEPIVSVDERQPLREAIQSCVDRLGEQDKAMIEAFFYEGTGYRGAAERAGVSRMTAHRRMPAAIAKLTDLLLNEPLVHERINP